MCLMVGYCVTIVIIHKKYENNKIKKYPTAKEVGQFAQTDLRRYFQNNNKNGITTFQDAEILKHLY